MQQAVAPCPEIVMSIKVKPTRSLLDSGSEVTLRQRIILQGTYRTPAVTIIGFI